MPQLTPSPFVLLSDIDLINQYTIISGPNGGTGSKVDNVTTNDITVGYYIGSGTGTTNTINGTALSPGATGGVYNSTMTQLSDLINFFNDSLTISSASAFPPISLSGVYTFTSPGIYYNGNATDFDLTSAPSSTSVVFDSGVTGTAADQYIMIVHGNITFKNTTFTNITAPAYNVIWYATGSITTSDTDSGLFGTFISSNSIYVWPNGSDTSIDANFYMYNNSGNVVFNTTGPRSALTDINNLLITTACFLKGTLILTEHGYVAIEDIKVGDELVSNGSILDNKTPKQTGDELKKVIWKGKQTIKNIDRETNPIVIKKHALGKNTPFQDLSVSPNHGLVVDDAFRPARDFINNDTILEDNETKELEYYHLELEGHCIISANGVLTESYLDFGNRYFFISQ
jgi:hypothetical protein